MFHLPAIHESLYASLLSLTESSTLGYPLPNSVAHPISVHTYPLVPRTPAFPLLCKAPTEVKPGNTDPTLIVNPHLQSATSIAYTRTLGLLRREIGPRFDLEKAWAEHIHYVRSHLLTQTWK